MRSISRVMVVATAVVVAIASPPAPAPGSAQERPPAERQGSPRPSPRERDHAPSARVMDEVKSRCLEQIDRRHHRLSRLRQRLAGARFLTDEHEAAVVQNLDATAASLSRLADVIQSEDNFEELKTECRSIVVDHRVFVLVIPQARLVVASDTEIAAGARLAGVGDRLQRDIDAAKTRGDDTAAAEQHLARMRQHIATAQERAGSVYGAVIAITPAQYNENPAVVDGPRAAVRAAAEELRAALAAARSAREALRK